VFFAAASTIKLSMIADQADADREIPGGRKHFRAFPFRTLKGIRLYYPNYLADLVIARVAFNYGYLRNI